MISSHRHVTLLLGTTDAELTWVELHIQGRKPLIIGSFYRPPNSAPSNLELLATSLRNTQAKFKNAILLIAGDFNLADIDWDDRIVIPYATESPKCVLLLDVCNEFFLDQMVKESSRIQDTIKHVLDLVLTTHPNFIAHCKVVAGISNHEVISSSINSKPNLN